MTEPLTLRDLADKLNFLIAAGVDPETPIRVRTPRPEEDADTDPLHHLAGGVWRSDVRQSIIIDATFANRYPWEEGG